MSFIPLLLQNIAYNGTGHSHQRRPYYHPHCQLSPLSAEAPIVAGDLVLHGKVTRYYKHIKRTF